MARLAEWLEGARIRTWPNAIAPVIAGTGVAAGDDHFSLPLALLTLVMSLLLITGVNYANDYSDGIRGTDASRSGPLRLVASGAASPVAVRNAALGFLGLGAVAGIGVVALSGHWWLLAVGAACLLAAWFYTGGSRPYGYAGLGELSVFVFFGLVAVLGTQFLQAGEFTGTGFGVAVAMGAFSSAVLVANNLRDIPTDRVVGKRTLAVLLGDRDTRTLYVALVLVPFLFSVLAGLRISWALLGFVALIPLVPAVRRVLGGLTGRALVAVLRDTGLAMLLWGVITGLALAVG